MLLSRFCPPFISVPKHFAISVWRINFFFRCALRFFFSFEAANIYAKWKFVRQVFGVLCVQCLYSCIVVCRTFLQFINVIAYSLGTTKKFVHLICWHTNTDSVDDVWKLFKTEKRRNKKPENIPVDLVSLINCIRSKMKRTTLTMALKVSLDNGICEGNMYKQKWKFSWRNQWKVVTTRNNLFVFIDANTFSLIA